MQSVTRAFQSLISAATPFSTFRWMMKIFSLTAVFFCLISFCLAQSSPAPAEFKTAPLFNAAAGLQKQGAPETIAVVDLNGGGKKDLIVAQGNCTCPSMVATYLGNGDGAFTLHQQSPLNVRNSNDGIGAHAQNLIAVGDFNRDGHPDFAVFVQENNPGTNYVDVYLGDGSGGFSFSNSYSIGGAGLGSAYNGQVVAADVNGDHKLDLLGINTGDNTVTVLLGKGDGTFENGVLYPACNVSGCAPYSITTGDFNKDGHLDIALADATGSIDILLNKGNGTFQAPENYPAPQCGSGASPCFGGYPDGESGIAAAALSDNGDLDVVITANSGVWVYMGNGDGTFKAPVNYGFPWGNSLAIADVNHDSKLDLVVSDYYNNSIWVLLGNGNGTFKSPAAYATDWNAQSLAVDDFNSDGNLDFAVGSDTGPFVTLGFGNRNGTFRSGTNFSVGDWIGQAAADFNHDGYQDIVQFSSSQFAVLLDNSHGVLGAPVFTKPTAFNAINWLAAGDVNGDGKADVVISYVINTTTFGIAVLLGNGNGTFQSPILYSTGDSNGYPGLILLADVNHDGKLDIIETNADDTVSVLLNNGNGTFGSPNVFAGGNGGFIAAADFNKDGKTDLAINDWNNNAIDIFFGKGDGTFKPLVSYPVVNHPEWVAVGDFNKDGKLDLATGGYSVTGGMFNNAGIAILLGEAHGTFGSATYYSTYPSGFPNDDPDSGVVADVNQDGIPDLLVTFATTHLGFGSCCATPNNAGLGVFLGNGDGTFTFENPLGQPGEAGGPFLVGTGSLGGGLVVRDFNHDGALDAAVLNAHNFGGGSGMGYTTVLLNTTPSISISPTSIKFAARKVGTESLVQTAVVTNDQASALSISNVTMGGADTTDYPFTSGCASSLLPGAQCTISIQFKPSLTGSRTASLQIADSLGTQTVSLSGTGQ